MRISILTNDEANKNFKSEHGLSIYIKHSKYNILFDLGYTNVFLTNANKLNLDLKQTEYIIISHGHYDHSGGLRYYQYNDNLKEIIIHKDAFNPKYKIINKTIKYNGIPFKENELEWTIGKFKKVENAEKINSGFYVLGNISHNLINTQYFVENKIDDFHDEIILILDEGDKLTLFMGCSHFGVFNGVKAVKNIFLTKQLKI